MFDSLEETIKHDDAVETSNRARIIKWVVVAVIAIAIFGGLNFAVRMMGN